MRFAFFILLVCFFGGASGQSLSLFTEANHGGSVTYLDLEFLNENLYISGWHRDTGNGIIWKHDEAGNLIDSVVYRDSVGIFLLKAENDYLLSYSRDRRNDSIFIAIRKLDANLNLFWKKEYNIGTNWMITKLRAFPFKGKNYVFIHYFSYGASFLKLDEEFNLEKFEHNQNMTINAYDPVGHVDSGFVFSTYRSHVIIDTNFNVSGQTVYPYNPLIGETTPFGELIEIDDDKRWFCGEYGDFNEGRTYSLMHFKDNYQTLTVYPYFGSQYDHSAYGYLRSIAPNADTSIIYATGVLRDPYPNQPAPFGSYEAYPFWVARLNADSLVWYQFYDDGNYYFPINMEVGADNCLYLACTRYEVDLLPSYSESVVFKITPELVGISEKPRAIKFTVYPNPGKNQISLNSGDLRGLFTMYNLQGQVVLSQESAGNATIDTGNLAQGVYLYRFVTGQGEVANGKWVKE